MRRRRKFGGALGNTFRAGALRSTSLWKTLTYTSPRHQEQPDSGEHEGY